MKLLTIDNDPEGVEIVELTIGMAWPEATTLSAGSGDAGISAVGSAEPNLVVLEVDLPDMDGFSVWQQQQEAGEEPEEGLRS